MALRFYFDHDSSDGAVVAGLRRTGLDIVTSRDRGMQEASDPEQLAIAVEENRVLYSANVHDFARLSSEWLSAGQSHPGIAVRFDQAMPIGKQIQKILLVSRMAPEEVRDRVISIDQVVE